MPAALGIVGESLALALVASPNLMAALRRCGLDSPSPIRWGRPPSPDEEEHMSLDEELNAYGFHVQVHGSPSPLMTLEPLTPTASESSLDDDEETGFHVQVHGSPSGLRVQVHGSRRITLVPLRTPTASEDSLSLCGDDGDADSDSDDDGDAEADDEGDDADLAEADGDDVPTSLAADTLPLPDAEAVLVTVSVCLLWLLLVTLRSLLVLSRFGL